MNRLRVSNVSLALVATTLTLSGCAAKTEIGSPARRPVTDSRATEDGGVQLTGSAGTRPIIVDGEPKGPETLVLKGTSGALLWPTAAVGDVAEGTPLSGTVAIVEKVAGHDDIIRLRVDGSAPAGSPYEGTKLVLEVDARDGKPLLGQGAVFLIRPGVESLRLGTLTVSTSNATAWCSVEMTSSPSQPRTKGMGITVRHTTTQ